MKVVLVRHGIAIDRADPDCPADPERSLTPVGVERAEVAFRALSALNLGADQVFTSPYRRAVETAAIAARAFGWPAHLTRVFEHMRPFDSPVELLQELRAGRPHSTTWAFGHAPHLDLTIAAALELPRKVTQMKKAGVALLELPSAGPATLIGLYAPGVLRRLAQS